MELLIVFTDRNYSLVVTTQDACMLGGREFQYEKDIPYSGVVFGGQSWHATKINRD